MNKKLLNELEKKIGITYSQLDSNLWTMQLGAVTLYFDKIFRQDEKTISLEVNGEHFCDFDY